MTMTDEDLQDTFGAHAPIVQFYSDAAEKVAAIDEKLGDSNAARTNFFETLKTSYPVGVELATAIIAQITAIEDENIRAVVSFMVSRERSFNTFAFEYATKTNPVVEAARLSDDERIVLYTDRSEQQKLAASLYATLKVLYTDDILANLPACPAGKKGGAPGKRGLMGRKLPNGISWTIKGESLGIMTTAKAAVAAGVKTSELRLALEKAYPESLPNPFTIVLSNGNNVNGSRSSTVVDDEDEDDEDEADTNEED